MDYNYPLGGTGALPRALENFVIDNKGEIRTNCDVVKINEVEKALFDSKGHKITYKKLVWAADNKTL